MPHDDASENLDTATRSASQLRPASGKSPVPALTIVGHPDPARVGDRATLPSLVSGNPAPLSRTEPHFAPLSGGAARPLGDARLSRRPVLLSRTSDGVVVDPAGSPTPIRADGVELAGPRVFTEARLRHGVALVLADRVVLLLHQAVPAVRRPESFGLVGESDEMLRLRHEIFQVADLSFPVLLRGETGTGKELVARALHANGSRAGKPFVSVNVGAIPRELASSELFGVARGAFTGAHRPRRGYFQRAHGGSLFLDEIGDAPREVQVPLFRVLETRQVQRVGSEAYEEVDVRVIAATDVDLEAAVAAGTFRSPLLQRLAAFEIELPPLRERRDDLGRLFVHFLAAELRELPEGERSESPPRIPAELTARLLAYDWPGNVRELRNAVRQIVVDSRGEPELALPPRLERRLAGTVDDVEGDDDAGDEPGSDPAPQVRRDADDVGEEELLAVLEAHGWEIRPTADALGVARGSLYKRIDRSPNVRTAATLSHEEIAQTFTSRSGDLDAMASALRVSKMALKQRMTKLGLR